MRDFYSRFYYALRFYLHKNQRLLRLAQMVRAYVILGPLRNVFVLYCQKFSNNKPLRTDTSPLFSNVDVEKLVNAIDDVGYAELGNLSEEHVAQILAYCENSKQIEYWNPHKNCEIVDRISRNTTIVAIVRKYLGAEPILWLTQLRWSFASSDNPVNLRPSLDRKPNEYDFHDFHYDAHDFKSLTAFVYLTDVNRDSGPHMIIPGTHKNKTLKDLAHIVIKDDVAQEIYHNKIKAILGNKGLVFLEDTSSYHKAAVCNKERRLLLSIDYVLRRKVPPERPLLHET
jgi:ectoine hydroxylase-related dioxygenase (phytanoyl-CoA dioxygenase family)